MARCVNAILWVAVWLAGVTPAIQGEPPTKPKLKIEFRWLATAPVPGTTAEKGIPWREGEGLLYPHLKPVLTNADIAGATLRKYDFSASGLGEQFEVEFRLADAARKKLIAGAGDKRSMMLAIFVNGRNWGARHFQKDEPARFLPSIGFTSSRAEAEQIVEACKVANLEYLDAPADALKPDTATELQPQLQPAGRIYRGRGSTADVTDHLWTLEEMVGLIDMFNM